ncbi:MAG: hypothetical protein C4B59_08745 [Candidatus Methanogaster sp.]|uniref:Uncharacterized protein n=1 Tax=Candidatus Methanogaster sp. TaxID=3386292 RepID=A0AC61L276_9EURY|nr:MAG: hypothetical protein C4B59_08745 [ANME-2 cluster archaeon]
MNLKEMVVFIATVTMFMVIFTSTAVAIVVDGDGSDWDPSDQLCDDPTGDTCSTGYDIESLWTCVEGNTVYFRIDVLEVAGDADNDGHPDTHTPGMSCSCDWDYPGVGVGATYEKEQYYIGIDGDHDGTIDYNLKYCSGDSSLRYPSEAVIPAAITDANHSGKTVEFSLVIDSYLDPTDYCVTGTADTHCNGNEDDTNPECRIDDDPNAEFSYTGTGCKIVTLDASASWDSEGPIARFEWDLDNDGVYEVDNGASPTYVADVATTGLQVGANTIRLRVTDSMGQTDSTDVPQVIVTGDPTAVAKANGHTGSIQLPVGGMDITFDGTGSFADSPATLDLGKCQWIIDGTLYAGLGPHTVSIDHATPASLKVEDNYGCISYGYVTIREPPSAPVPLLTPAGILALIGMLCIVGAGRVITKGRRL